MPPLKTANRCGPPSWVRGCDLEDLTGSWSPVCAWCRYFVCRGAKEHGVRLQSCRGGWRKEYGAQTDHSSALLGTATHTLNVGHRQRGMKRQLEVAHTTLPIKTTQQWLAGDTTLLEESAAWLPGERTRAAVANTTMLLVDTVNTFASQRGGNASLRASLDMLVADVGHRATADTFSIAGGWGNSALSGRYSPFVGGGKECYAKVCGDYAFLARVEPRHN